MSFESLDQRMRVYEVNHAQRIPANLFMVARLDGRSFTRLTKEVHRFDLPFDARFKEMMIATLQHLMQGGFKVSYGYAQSDELSLLLHRQESLFARNAEKIVSTLAG